MIFKDIELKLDYEKLGIAHDGYVAHLSVYLPDLRGKNAGKAVLILPGGGYAMTSDREGEPVALEFLRRGIAAFVLWYSVAPNRYPASHLETAESIKLIRKNAAEWKIDPNELYICGFSAGGHLAGSYTVLSQTDLFTDLLGGKKRDYAVAGAILGYPVVTSGIHTHGDSFRNLLGDRYEELKDGLSVEKLVTKNTPRMFLFHTAADSCVPVANSLLLATALAEHKVPFELHVYQTKEHGMSVATNIVGWDSDGLRHTDWPKDAIEWMEGK